VRVASAYKVLITMLTELRIGIIQVVYGSGS
jgi:hypothetical protein